MSMSTDKLEAGIEHERASLASTISKIHDRVSVESLAQDALDTIRTNAAAYTKSIDRAVRANPAAVALTGIGIAWLIFGSRKRTESEAPRTIGEDRWLDEGGALDAAEDGPLGGSQVPHTDDEWAYQADRIRREASASLDRIEREEQEAASGLGAAYRKARDYASERAEVVADFTAGLRKSFTHGLDDLTETAREKIVALRQNAYAAGLKAESFARRSSRQAGRMFDDHPLVAGAAAVAAGAALAAFLPRTQTEDRAFGAERDRLMRQAAAALRDERNRAERVAKGVGEELKTAAHSIKETLSDEIGETAQAVKERASEEAEASVKKKGAAAS